MNINFPKSASPAPASFQTSSKRPSVLQLLAVLVIGVLFFWFVARPKAKDLAGQKASAASLAQESARLNEQQGKLASLVRQLESSAKDIVKLDESLPLHPRTTWVYLLVQSLAESSGMTVSSLVVSPAEGPVAGDSASLEPFSRQRAIKKIPADLGVAGTFQQFEAFLKKLENSGRIIDIKTMEINPASGGSMDFRLAFDVYYFGVAQ